MSNSLCNRCDLSFRCALNYDGIPCRENRSVEPTEYDRIMDADENLLAGILAQYAYSAAKQDGGWLTDARAVKKWLRLSPEEADKEVSTKEPKLMLSAAIKIVADSIRNDAADTPFDQLLPALKLCKANGMNDIRDVLSAAEKITEPTQRAKKKPQRAAG